MRSLPRFRRCRRVFLLADNTVRSAASSRLDLILIRPVDGIEVDGIDSEPRPNCCFLAGTRHTVQFLRLACVNLECRCRHIFLEMLDLGSSRDWKYDGRSSQKPRQSYL